MHEIVKSECQLIIVLQSWVLVLVVGVVQTRWNKRLYVKKIYNKGMAISNRLTYYSVSMMITGNKISNRLVSIGYINNAFVLRGHTYN